MTAHDALLRAQECERMALATTNPERRVALQQMRQMWLTLAQRPDEFQNIDAEFDQLIALQAEVGCDRLQ